MGGEEPIPAQGTAVPFDPTSQGKRYVRFSPMVELAMNEKEDYEIVRELFLGNDMYEEDKVAHDVKIAKLLDLI